MTYSPCEMVENFLQACSMFRGTEKRGFGCLQNFLTPFLRTDKWAETELGTKWGDKWEEKFFGGIGSRQGETWHVSPRGESMPTFCSFELQLYLPKGLRC